MKRRRYWLALFIIIVMMVQQSAWAADPNYTAYAGQQETEVEDSSAGNYDAVTEQEPETEYVPEENSDGQYVDDSLSAEDQESETASDAGPDTALGLEQVQDINAEQDAIPEFEPEKSDAQLSGGETDTEPSEDGEETGPVLNTIVNGSGNISFSTQEPSPGDTVTVTAAPASGYYLAQIRISYIKAAEGNDPEQHIYETLDLNDKTASFTMPEGPVTVYGDFIRIVWDGTIDLTWYDPNASVFRISYPAQLAGAAVLTNGLFNDMPVRDETVDGKTVQIPEVDDGEGNAISLNNESAEGHVAADDGSGYQVFPDIDGDGINTAVAGDLDIIRIYHKSGESGANIQLTSNTYWYGGEDFTGKTIELARDLDMGGVLASGYRKTIPDGWSGPNYMPLGGQYSMDKSNGYTRLTAGFNGTFNGCGHMVYNMYISRHTATFGNCQAVGLIGLLGIYRVEDGTVSSPAVMNVAVDGLIYGNRSIGGIVGKTVHSKGSVIRNCINFATVYNTDAKGCGGIIGAGWYDPAYGDKQLVVENCANFGLVCTGYNKNAGGLIGSSEAAVFDSYTTGYATGEGKGNGNAGQALGTNNGGAAWYNCYALEGGGSCTRNEPGTATAYVYNSTYGSAIRVLAEPSEIKNRIGLLNGKVRIGGPDENGYMDDDSDVIANTKRNWVEGLSNSGQQIISDHLADSLSSVESWHQPGSGFSDLSVSGMAAGLTAWNATGMPVPRSFIHDSSDMECIVSTGTPTMEYLTGESFDTGDHGNQSEGPYDTDTSAEFSVWAVFSDGTCQEITDYHVVYGEGSSTGTEFTEETENAGVTVQGTYLGQSYSFSITGIKVTACELLEMKMTAAPLNTFYMSDEDFNPEGMTLSMDYGSKGASGENDTVSMTVKATWDQGKIVFEKQVLDTSPGAAPGTYKKVTMSETAAQTYQFVFDQTDPSAVTVSHTFNGKTMSETISITRSEEAAPRLWKDGENDRQVVYITSESDLLWFANQVATGLRPDMWAELENDITIRTLAAPIGYHDIKTQKQYTGVFDGKGHTIDIEMTRSGNAALFYSIGEEGKVCDLTLTGSMSGGSRVGAVTSFLDGGAIESCISSVNITGTGKDIGGIAGLVRTTGSTISKCGNFGAVSGGTSSGGISGQISSGTVRACFNKGDVTCKTGTEGAGGIAGVSGSDAVIVSCYSTGMISITEPETSGKSKAGGLAGSISDRTQVRNCFVMGETSCGGINDHAGIFAGSAAKPGTGVKNNYALIEAGEDEGSSANQGLVGNASDNFTPKDSMIKAIDYDELRALAAALNPSGEAEFRHTGCVPVLTWETRTGHEAGQEGGICTHECTLCHGITAGEPKKENIKEATYSSPGSYDLVTYCLCCGDEISRKTVTIPKKIKPAADVPKAGTEVVAASGTVKIISTQNSTVAFTKAKDQKSVTVPSTVVFKGKTYQVTRICANAFTGAKIRTVTVGENVDTIEPGAFKGSKVTKLIVKSKKLTKASVKGSLKGSKIKTVQVKVGKKKVNKKFVKKYKKFFTKKNAGKKVKVK